MCPSRIGTLYTEAACATSVSSPIPEAPGTVSVVALRSNGPETAWFSDISRIPLRSLCGPSLASIDNGTQQSGEIFSGVINLS
jgi:hypothetical protein